MEALLAGLAKHGSGKWTSILDDPEFAAQLLDRTNINLKDKWRNIKKSRTQSLESTSIFTSPSETSRSVVSYEASPSSSSDMSNDARYDAMVFEAVSTINDENGSNLKEILRFIEGQHEVPQNFKKLLSYSLGILVSQDKLKKVRNRYKISVTKAIKPTLTLRPKDSTKPPELPNWYEEQQDFRMFLSECLIILVSQGKLEKVLDRYKISELENKVLEVAPEVVAMKLAESDNKRLIAAEAVEEEERMHKLVEESHTMLQLCLEIHQQCALGQEVVLL
ncbi:Winged helix DNA-binding domain superfamily [Arabidopsis thaliana x Arabidopsis arenosa]|uniref:Winged helix DNA-binding domain superfamily n=1 Tax=Arabidopsis thaliana x Arabidopsis arenosa TaxID=1240361 RepID=A0A8T2GQ42_9BRAS|nr:Winged helix DNA-binding domain superfamily [Arabidopsis thaliana x Arabidopsis arenosa]